MATGCTCGADGLPAGRHEPFCGRDGSGVPVRVEVHVHTPAGAPFGYPFLPGEFRRCSSCPGAVKVS